MKSNFDRILLTSREAAHRLSVSERTLFQLRKEGRIPAVQFGRNIRYHLDDLDAFADRHRTQSSLN